MSTQIHAADHEQPELIRMIARCKKKFIHFAWRQIIGLLDVQVPFLEKNLSAPEVSEIKSLLRPGDVLLETNNAYPCWRIAVAVTLQSQWMHAAIYVGDETVIDAGTFSYVAALPLDSFLQTSRIAILRPKYSTQADLEVAIATAKSYLGHPFNITFDHSRTDAVYCAQLISNSLKAMPNPIVFSKSRMLWKQIVSPKDIACSNHMELIWRSKK